MNGTLYRLERYIGLIKVITNVSRDGADMIVCASYKVIISFKFVLRIPLCTMNKTLTINYVGSLPSTAGCKFKLMLRFRVSKNFLKILGSEWIHR